ncbi:hypothetical protein GF402_01400 [Candidatus Fermentibacteria bacterium]|nr:hypothetical protein [Candidatus Fermentibacteria bacterium]
MIIFAARFAHGPSESDAPLLPESINRILSRITPEMSEEKLTDLVREYYPDAEATIGVWSGQNGYVEFELTDRYSISIAEYKDLQYFELRFVHPDLIYYVYDRRQKKRIDISLYEYGDRGTTGSQ